jgi:tetratricopeptide (TPR) repeat protein
VVERFSDRYPGSINRDVAYFNLAKVALKAGDTAVAVDGFYRVVDVEPSSPLAAPAYVLAGATLLESGEVAKCIFPLRRAAALAADDRYIAYAAAKLAVAYLLDGKPRAANLVLRNHRNSIVNSPARTYAAFLDSFALLQATPAPMRRPYHNYRLLSALLALDTGFSALGTPERVLMAEAYERLGLSERAAKVASAALEGKPAHAYLPRLILPMLHHYRNIADLESATNLLAQVGESLDAQVYDLAVLELAEIAATKRQWQRSIALCLQLLRKPHARARTKALKLLGRAFEQLGEYRLAALCYAGRVDDLQRLLQLSQTTTVPDDSRSASPLVTDRAYRTTRTAAAQETARAVQK